MHFFLIFCVFIFSGPEAEAHSENFAGCTVTCCALFSILSSCDIYIYMVFILFDSFLFYFLL